MALRRGAGAVLAGLGGITIYRYQGVKQRESQLPSNSLKVFQDAKPKKHQRVIIIGAGVVGVSAAYKLGKFGHEVVVLVRQ